MTPGTRLKGLAAASLGAMLLVVGATAVPVGATSTDPPTVVARYDGGGGFDTQDGLATSPDGSTVYMGGESFGSQATSYDYAAVAVDSSTGDLRWVTRYNGPGSSFDGGRDLAADSQLVVETGFSSGVGTLFDYATVALDPATGAHRWVRRYDGPAHSVDEAQAVGISPDGSKVFVTGYSTGDGTSYDIATIAYDAASGQRLWKARYDGPASSLDVANDIAVTPGIVFVTGYSTGIGTDVDFTTIAYDPVTGAQLWLQRWDGPSHGRDNAFAVAVAPNGSRVYVTGFSGGSGPLASTDITTIGYDAAGTQVWADLFDGPAHGDDGGNAVTVAPNSRQVYVAGFASGGTTDYATLFFDAASGQRRLAILADGGSAQTDNANGVAVDPSNGRVYVTGVSGAGTTDEILTIAYDPVTGAEKGRVRYDGPAGGEDSGREVVVVGHRVVVGGSSDGGATVTDFVGLIYGG